MFWKIQTFTTKSKFLCQKVFILWKSVFHHNKLQLEVKSEIFQQKLAILGRKRRDVVSGDGGASLAWL